jgi:hypothetical protein
MNDMLNRSQTNALTVTLRNLERAMLDLESLCTDDTAKQPGILLQRSNPLAPAQRTELAAQLVEARRILGQFAGHFALPAQVEDEARTARSKLVIAWATLEDIKSPKLGRYGKVSEALQDELDPHIDRLIAIVGAMERILPVNGE